MRRRPIAPEESGRGAAGAPDAYRRGAYLVGVVTLCSRVSGVARDAALAMLLGASLLNDLFQLCFELPNLARRVAGDSALAPLALPLRQRMSRERGRSGVQALAWRGGLWFLGAGTVLAIVAALASPWIARAFLPSWGGLMETAEGMEVASRAAWLTRLTSLYFAALLSASFLSAMLQGEREFLLPALGGLPLNLLLIALCGGALWIAGPRRVEGPAELLADDGAWLILLTLACGILAGGALRLALVAWGMARLGFRPVRGAPELAVELRRLMKRAGPMLLVLAAPQLHVTAHLMLVSFFASSGAATGFDPEGTLSLLRYAHRVMEFPLALFAGALAATTLPAMFDDDAPPAPSLARGEASHLGDSMRRFLFVGVPATVGLALLSRPCVALLFQRGAWNAGDSAACARFLAMYAIALVPLGLCHIATPAGLAFAGARPMLRDALASLAVGSVASAVAMVATGDPAFLPLGMIPAEAWRLRATLRRVRRASPETGTPLWSVAKGLPIPILASAAMALALVGVSESLLPGETVERAGAAALGWRLGLAIALGAAVYFAAAWGLTAAARRLRRR